MSNNFKAGVNEIYISSMIVDRFLLYLVRKYFWFDLAIRFGMDR